MERAEKKGRGISYVLVDISFNLNLEKEPNRTGKGGDDIGKETKTLTRWLLCAQSESAGKTGKGDLQESRAPWRSRTVLHSRQT